MADAVQILAGGLTGAVLNQIWNEARASFSERRDGKLTAMLLAAELDAYVFACAERRQDIKNSDSSDGEFGRAWRTIPELPVFSDKTNWRALGMELTQQIVRFRAVILVRNKGLEAIWEVADSDAVTSEASDLCVKTGLEAIKFATALRAKHKIKPAQAEDQWDAPAYLATEWIEIQDRKRAAEERAAQRTREMEAAL